MTPGSEALVSDVDALDLARRPTLLPDEEGALGEVIDCGDCGRAIPFGRVCQHCIPGCDLPGGPACPGRE